MELDLAKVNTKLDSIKVTLAGVLAKELNPHLRTLMPTPTVVLMKTRSVPTTTRSTEDIVNLIEAASKSTENTVNLVPTAARSTENTPTAARSTENTINLIPAVTRSAVNQGATTTRSTEDIVSPVPSVTRYTESTAKAMVSMPACQYYHRLPLVLRLQVVHLQHVQFLYHLLEIPPHPVNYPTPTNGLDIPLGRDITSDTSGQQLVSVPELTAFLIKVVSGAIWQFI